MLMLFFGIAIGIGITALLGVIVLAVVWASRLQTKVAVLGERNQSLQADKDQLLGANDELNRRVELLESTARTRMPHEAKLELLNALAVIEHKVDDIGFDADILHNVAGHINNALEVGTTRQGRTK